MTPDPIGFADGPNLYAYVHNNPLTYVDPYGLFWAEAREMCQGATRGYVDDASWGVSEYAMGEYHGETMWGSAGYYAGAGASLGVGMLYGSTEAKICKEAASLLGKGVAMGYKSLKSLRVTKLTSNATRTVPVKQIIEQTSHARTSIKVSGNVNKRMLITENLNSNGYIRGNKGWELKNRCSTRNSEAIINGRRYTGHALDQMQNRGFMPSVVENTITVGRQRLDRIPNRTQHYDPRNNCTVITDKGSDVITVKYGEK